MPLSTAQITQLKANAAAIDAALDAVAVADIAELAAAQTTLDQAIGVQDAYLATFVADSPPVITPPPVVTGTAGNTKTVLLDFDSTEHVWSSLAYDIIMLNSWNYNWVPAIHAAGKKAFVYKDLSSVRDNSCTGGSGDSCISAGGVLAPSGVSDSAYLPTGVGFCYAWRNHPEWFLKNAAGQLITETGYPTQYMMDFGNPAYQAAWLAGVKADVAAGGWDGVFIDNALTNTGYGTPALYPTPAAIQAATLSMLKVVGPGLTSAWIFNIANVGYDNLYPTLWAEWLPYCNGLCQEFFAYWGDDSAEGAGNWSAWLEPEIQAAVAQNKTCLFNIGGGTLTTAQIEYAVASILLYTDGNQLISYGDSSDDTQDPVWNLGAALGPAVNNNGVYTREFVDGSVTVNPAAGTGTITTTITT